MREIPIQVVRSCAPRLVLLLFRDRGLLYSSDRPVSGGAVPADTSSAAFERLETVQRPATYRCASGDGEGT